MSASFGQLRGKGNVRGTMDMLYLWPLEYVFFEDLAIKSSKKS